MKSLSQSTLMPISFSLLVIGGGAGWATRQEIIAADNQKQIELTLRKFDLIENRLMEIIERLSRIEGRQRR